MRPFAVTGARALFLLLPRLAGPAALLALALGLGNAGCAQPNSVLLVTVEDGSGKLTTVTQLQVKVSIDQVMSQFNAPGAMGAPLTFPTTFTVELDRSRTGALMVSADAVNASGSLLATASTTLPALVVGSTNRVTLHFGAAAPDAGVDAAPDVRDAGGDGTPDLANADLGASDGAGPDAIADGALDGAGELPAVDGSGSAGATGSGGSTGTGGAPGVGGASGAGGSSGGGGETGGSDGAAGALDAGADADDAADPDGA